MSLSELNDPLPKTSVDNTNVEVFSLPAESKPFSVTEMEQIAKKLRRHIITMIGKANSGHPGGSLSAVEIVTALYFGVLQHKPSDPQWIDRDRFILSKGHAAPLLYAALAECGYFPVTELTTLRQLNSRLQGHVDRNITPGIEMSSGALGQGLSHAIGIALAGRLNSQQYKIYVMLGDGECDEGQVWEGAMAAAHYKLDNLVAIVDNNDLQIDGWNRDVMNLEPFNKKWESFGWNVIEADGHNLAQLISSFNQATLVKGRPTVIIAHTIKGKGVSFMENNINFHGKAPTATEVETALKELE
ncbi:MAG: transketolase [Dehalococcoidales bacterium]|nr:transketolase [Dehalococcoidales bacterium]